MKEVFLLVRKPFVGHAAISIVNSVAYQSRAHALEIKNEYSDSGEILIYPVRVVEEAPELREKIRSLEDHINDLNKIIADQAEFIKVVQKKPDEGWKDDLLKSITGMSNDLNFLKKALNSRKEIL